MKTYNFKVIVREDPKEDGTMAYTAYCPDLDGCMTWGYTLEETFANMKEAIECYIESLVAHGEPIPIDVVEEEIDTALTLDANLKVTVCQ
jgi:antitoxin HicB